MIETQLWTSDGKDIRLACLTLLVANPTWNYKGCILSVTTADENLNYDRTHVLAVKILSWYNNIFCEARRVLYMWSHLRAGVDVKAIKN